MKRRSTRSRKEEEDNSSSDSDAATTKPTSRALKGLLPFNKSGNQEDTTKTITGGDSSGRDGGGTNSTSRNRISGLDKNAASGGVGVGRDDHRDFRSDRRKFVLRDKQNGAGGVSDSVSRSTQSGRSGTANTGTGTGINKKGKAKKTTTYHNLNVELSPTSSSSSSKSSSSKSSKGSTFVCTSSDDDDDDNDDDYVDKRGKKRQQSSGTKMDGRKKKKGGKKEATAAVSPVAPVAANCVTGLDVLKKFAAETKAKRIGLFPRASEGGINIYAFDGTEFRSDQFQQLSLKTIIKVTGKERTKKIVMTIKQEQTVEEDFDVGF